MAAKPSDPARFAERLNRLRYSFRPLGRDDPLTAKEISDGVRECTGQSMSESSIRYLINGDRQPKLETAALLARYFGVSTSYFTDCDVSAVEADLGSMELLRQLKDARVTHVAARLAEVSDAELEIFASFVRQEENRRADPGRTR